MDIGSVLFSAGVGKRLRPLTGVLAKPSVPVLDLPLGGFGLADLLSTAPPVVVNVSHLPETVLSAFEEHFPGAPWLGFTEQPEGFGTAGTLAALKKQIRERVVVRNADTFSDVEASDVLTTHFTLGAPLTVAVQPVDTGADFVVDGDRAVGFVDRRIDPAAPGVRYIGVAVLEKSAIKKIPNARPLGLGESVFKPMVESGDVAVHVHDGYALDVGTVANYLQANLDALEGRGPQPFRMWPGTFDTPSTFVGNYATVAPGALGEGAVVMSGALVGSGASVERAVVLPGEIVRAGTQVRDCVWFQGAALT